MIWEALSLFLLGMILVSGGAELSTNAASSLAKSLNLPPILLGLSLIAFGTSAPELFVSGTAALKGSETMDISLTNILGSNVANIGLALGLPLLIAPITIDRKNDLSDTLIMLGITFCFFLLAFSPPNPGKLAVIEGILLLLLFSGYISWLFYRYQTDQSQASALPEEMNTPEEEISTKHWFVNLLLAILGLAGLIWGADFMVDNSVKVARSMGVSTALIGVSLVALGTSIPEVAICVVGALRDRSSLSLGNIIGSNIFNLLLVGGVASVSASTSLSMTREIWIYGGFTFGFSLLLGILVWKGENVGVKTGLLFLFLYVLFILYLVSTI